MKNLSGVQFRRRGVMETGAVWDQDVGIASRSPAFRSADVIHPFMWLSLGLSSEVAAPLLSFPIPTSCFHFL